MTMRRRLTVPQQLSYWYRHWNLSCHVLHAHTSAGVIGTRIARSFHQYNRVYGSKCGKRSTLHTSFLPSASVPSTSSAFFSTSNNTASNSSSSNLTLKACLRQLYLRVHPDLLEAYPKEREVNSASFVLLKNFVEELFNGHLHSNSISLRFYMHDRTSPASSSTSASNTASSEIAAQKKPADPAVLKSVSITIPPPYSDSPPPAKKDNKASSIPLVERDLIENALSELFELAGIESEFTWEGTPLETCVDEDEPSESTNVSSEDIASSMFAKPVGRHPITLTEFLVRSISSAHQVQPRESLGTVSVAYLRSFGIHTVFLYVDHEGTSEEQHQYELVQQWIHVMTASSTFCTHLHSLGIKGTSQIQHMSLHAMQMGESMQGMHQQPSYAHYRGEQSMRPVMMGSNDLPFASSFKHAREVAGLPRNANNPLRELVFVFSPNDSFSHIDHTGRVVLSTLTSDTEWLSFLDESNLISKAHSARSRYLFLKSLEKETRNHLGLHDVWCEPFLQSNTAYEEMLNQWMGNGYYFKTMLRELPHLQALSLRIVRKSPHSKLSVDKEIGVVVVPLGSSAKDTTMFLMASGHQALLIQEKYKSFLESYSSTLLEVKRKLRLRRLERLRSVSESQMLSACRRLLGYHGIGRARMEGEKVNIGQSYAINENGTYSIPWDWE